MMAGSEIPNGPSLMSSQLHMGKKSAHLSSLPTFYNQSRLSISQLCPVLYIPENRLELSLIRAVLTSARSLCAISFLSLPRDQASTMEKWKARRLSLSPTPCPPLGSPQRAPHTLWLPGVLSLGCPVTITYIFS